MPSASPILIARGPKDIRLLPRMVNRHGLIAGATGTGKTVTLRLMAESLSAMGVPVFLPDIKGDLTGIAMPGGDSPKVMERAKALGIEGFSPEGCPVRFWDLFCERGHPVRAKVSEMGPLLMARALGLNDTQGGVLEIVFKAADDEGLLLIDLKDLRAMVKAVSDNADAIRDQYGNVSSMSVGAIQRALLQVEQQGGDKFFGEPAIELNDLIAEQGGRGVINVLAAERLVNNPKLYGVFLLWLLSELFEQLPEVGDMDKPKFVMFFDEAHLLFDDIPKGLVDKIEQVVRLVRSKGVGVYFVTQNPLDIPDAVLGQLGNRVQHALRAFTPKDQKAVRAAAETFRANPALDTAKAIMELGVGEALVSVLDDSGTPTVVERAMICPPRSRMAPLSAAELADKIKASSIYGEYEEAVDRVSAYEELQARETEGRKAAEAEAAERAEEAGRAKAAKSGGTSLLGAFAKSAARAVGSSIGRSIVRGMLGSIFGGASTRRAPRKSRGLW